MCETPTGSWSLAQFPARHFTLPLVNYGCVSEERVLRKHFGVGEHFAVLLCLPFVPSCLLCSAQHKHTLSLFVAWVLAAWKFPSCHSTGQREKLIANKQCWKWPDSTGLKCFSLPCVLPLIFLSDKPLAQWTLEVLHKKSCPSWISPFGLQEVADAMTDWKLFLCAWSLPALPLYYKHCVCSSTLLRMPISVPTDTWLSNFLPPDTTVVGLQ